MTQKELKKLSRKELLEILIDLKKENERLMSQVKRLKGKLRDKKVAIENAGSIAEAALQLSGIFEAAQNACQIYIENVAKSDCDDSENE